MLTMKTALEYPGLQKQPDLGESHSWIRHAMRRFLRGQFGCPTGFWGDVAGKIMACTPSNHDRLQWTLSLLDLQPDDRLLEIGFGPGFAIEQASKIVLEGFIAGIDHSDVMVRQASKRNARAIRDGRVVLQLGSAFKPPKFRESFNKIFTINSIHFWEQPIECLRKLRQLLIPGGLIAVTLQPRSRRATDAMTNKIGQEIAMKLKMAGFSQVRLEMRQTKPVAVACALGIK
jgi:SAM-dependent methyltransferase